jgi:hypothetical protein
MLKADLKAVVQKSTKAGAMGVEQSVVNQNSPK